MYISYIIKFRFFYCSFSKENFSDVLPLKNKWNISYTSYIGCVLPKGKSFTNFLREQNIHSLRIYFKKEYFENLIRTRKKYFYELQKNTFPCKKIIKNSAFFIEFYLTY
eukprot:snap_masked-scaffold_57-processed-gene-1.11-mRNA-1 protein AED:1.00 eAED:1.00 QI:0/0/0/0/1/1/5/0/108